MVLIELRYVNMKAVRNYYLKNIKVVVTFVPGLVEKEITICTGQKIKEDVMIDKING